MTSVNQQQDFSDNTLDTLIISNLIRQIENDKKNADPKALLATLSKSLEEVLDAIGSGGKSEDEKIVHVDFGSEESTQANTDDNLPNSQIPTNSTMEQAIGQLMGLLAELEGEIAKWGNQKAQYDSEIGKALMNEMSAQVKEAQKNLNKTLHEIKKENFWSIFTKVAEAVAGALICAIALLCGQPELAVIVLVMTVLAVSGGMDKMTNGISDVLQKAGLPPETAHIVAAATIVVASIAITVATCGAGAAGTVETTVDASVNIGESVAENSGQIADTAANVAETSADTVSESAEQTQSFMSRVQNFFSKVGNFIKNYNPFKFLPKSVNLGIVAGSMAIGNTNFAEYLATICVEHMKDGKKKDEIKEVIEIVVNLLAALVGAGAGAAVAAGPAMYQLNNTATLLKGLVAGQAASGVLLTAGQVGSADAELEMAQITEITEDNQASLYLLRSMISMNNSQSQADSKALSSQLRGKAEGLETLTADVGKEGAAVADVLRS